MKDGTVWHMFYTNMIIASYKIAKLCNFCRTGIWLSILLFCSLSILTVRIVNSPRINSAGTYAQLTAGFARTESEKIQVCGRPLNNEDITLLDRIKRRADCRFVRPIPPRLQPDAKDPIKNVEYYVTHDLENAIGLGNFMFIAASTIGLGFTSDRIALLPYLSSSKKHHLKFEHPFPMWEPINGNIPHKFENVVAKTRVRDDAAGIYNTSYISLLKWRNKTKTSKPIIALHGYLQSWKYFQDIQELIKWQMIFERPTYQHAVKELETKLSTYVRKSGLEPTSIVGIHVRRGDLLDPKMRKYGHTVAPKSYLRKVVAKVNTDYPNCVFALVSNDLKFCQDVLAGTNNVLYMDANSAEVDMAILTLMDHLILTVGTFGWWGAYLSDAKDVYYYKHWPKNDTIMAKEYIAADYFLPHWTAVG